MAGHILIVEDELAIADAIAYALKTEGFTPQVSHLGEEALSRLRQGASNWRSWTWAFRIYPDSRCAGACAPSRTSP